MADTSSSSSGISFAGLLTIVFITLKLMGTITWSWWWVLSPALISVALWLLIILAVLVIGGIAIAGSR